MILGRIAVGAIIFSVVLALLALLFKLPEWFNNGEDWAESLIIIIMLLISLYCAISGTYLLYLGGKI